MRWNRDTFRLIKNDLKNAIFSHRFIVSVLLGWCVCYFTLLFCGDYKSETLHKFILIHDTGQSFLAYIVGILPLALCFYEDIVHGNIRSIIGRIRLREYIFSKTVSAYVTSILSFVIGKLLFVYSYSIGNVIYLPTTFDIIPNVLYLDFIAEGNWILFFIATSLHKALYCALLCQIVMMFSVITQNISIIFSIPILIFYVAHFYINTKVPFVFMNLSKIFDGATVIWGSDLAGFLYALGIMLLLGYAIYCATLKIYLGKLYHE